MSKYAPAREDGMKPYLVTMFDWGRQVQKVVYADSPGTARYEAVGRSTPGRYVSSCRRATKADIESTDD